MNHDVVMDRNCYLLLNGKTDYDEKVAVIVTHSINIVSNVRDIAVEASIG
jgi:dihydrofolate reductase